MKISPFAFLLVTSIPFGLFAPSSEAIMQKENLQNNKNSSIELVAMGCHGGGGNNLKKRAEKEAIQAELKTMVDELKAKDSK